jgi:apolipoprotein N-acyltransferase
MPGGREGQQAGAGGQRSSAAATSGPADFERPLPAHPAGPARPPRDAVTGPAAGTVRGRATGWQGPALRWALPCALAGGLALAAAFPPAGAWPLAAVGPALLAVALRGRGVRGSLLTGLVFGTAFFVPLLSWVVNVAWYAWAALAAADTLLFAVLTLGLRLLLRLPGWPLASAGWWVAAEAVRDRWPWGGFPWGRLAMSQAGSPAAPWAAIGGAPLVTFLVALAGGTLAWVLASLPAASRGRVPRPRLAPVLALAGSAGLAAAGPLLGAGRWPATAPTVTVAAVQGNVPHARDLPGLLRASTVTGNHARATERLAAAVRAGRRPAPDLVIWPENSTDLDPGFYPPVYDAISRAVAAIGRPVLVGAVLQDPVRNAGLLWLPRHGPVAAYIKRQLVPFGEVIPFRGLLSHITPLVRLQPQNFTPGHGPVVFRTGRIRLGDVICYEVGFDRRPTPPSRWTGRPGKLSSSSRWPGSGPSSRTGRWWWRPRPG